MDKVQAPALDGPHNTPLVGRHHHRAPVDDSESPSRPVSDGIAAGPLAEASERNLMPPPPRPTDGLSGNGNLVTKRNGKRLTLNFPIQPASSPTPAPSSAAATPRTSDSTAGLEGNAASPTDSTGFLVALAAQERRVLELREELHRAEGDLDRLKRQWATHEVVRKRDEIRHVEQMQSLPTARSSLDDGTDEGPAARRSSTERPNAAAARDPKPSRRKVISGQSHHRALSLLSPERRAVPSSPHSRRLTESNVIKPTDHDQAPQTMMNASSSMPTLAASTQVLTSPSRDAFISTGRRMAEDFKEGLLTFIDDLRQATVGDEPVNGPGPRPNSQMKSSPSAKRHSRHGSRNGMRETQSEAGKSGVRVNRTTEADPPVTQTKHIRGASADVPTQAQGTLATEAERTDGGLADRGPSNPPDATSVPEPVPESPSANRRSSGWQSIVKLSPGVLKRSAADFMTGWENSLVSPSDRRVLPTLSSTTPSNIIDTI